MVGVALRRYNKIQGIPNVTSLRSQRGLNRHQTEQDSSTKMHDFNIRVNSHIGLAFVFIFSYLILIKGDCGRNGYNEDNERREMSYNPELSYKMAILSAVTYDQSHPQHCLDQYLPSAKFQLQTVVTKNCDFVDRKCQGHPTRIQFKTT